MSPLLFIIIFAIIYFAILKQPFGLHEGLIALIGAALVLVLGIVSLSDAKNYLLFSSTHPWQIIIFFITFAVISTTLDDLGFFRWCAIKATILAKHDGLLLFNYLFILTALVTVFTANDIVILTLTPFILHLGIHHNRHPRAYLLMMFIVANTGSTALILGNLTNLIVADAFKVNFLEFSKYMLIPTIAAFVVEYFILKWYFRKEINTTFTCDAKIRPEHAIKDKKRISYALGILWAVLFMAIFQPIHGISLWIITSAGAFMVLLIGGFSFIHRIKRLPWQVVLFVASLFVIIIGFQNTGIISILSRVLSLLQDKSLLELTILAPFVTSIIASIMNNIPGTMTMTHILAASSINGLKHTSLVYAIIVGSNLGANLTIIGALAGLMWLHLIRQKNYYISAWEFSKVGIITMIPVLLVIGLILYIELLIF
jgi:arsenical pump membrane protein